MKKQNSTYSFFLCIAFLLIGHIVNGQNQSILDFTVKELNGDTLEFRKKLEPNSNYVIETMAFWCNPCIRSIDKFNYHKNYWRERFNTDIILIEDEHWDDVSYVIDEMQEIGGDIDIVISNDQFSTVGINSIPRYFFKGIASDTIERVYGNIEKFLLERVDSIKFSPILNEDFKQALQREDCDGIELQKYSASNDTIIEETKYHLFNNIPFRENDQNGNIIRYDIENGKEEIHIKYSTALCSRIWIKDLDGDSLLIKVLDRFQVDSVLHVVTDQFISNGCSEEDIPFEFIQNIGSNAGLFFEINDSKISSRLICHEQNEKITYADDEFGSLCLSLSNKDPRQNIEVQAYPNPVSSTLFINLNFDGEKKVEIFTPSGQRIALKLTRNNQIEINLPKELRSSLLLVKVSSDYGTVVKKVFKIEN